MELKLALKLPFIVLIMLFDFSSAALLGLALRPKGWSYKRNLKYALLRSALRTGLLDLLVDRLTATVDIYSLYMKDQESEPDVVMLDGGARGGWIGPSKAKKVLVYFHGGAYTSSARPEHMQILGDLVATAREQGKDFSVLVVEYTLAPKASYPVQMTQAAYALKYLIETAGYDPENIYIAGDSAGGHLAIALLSTLSHPHPAAPKIDLKGKKLAGAYLISPWVTFEGNTDSMKSNVDKDYVRQSALEVSSSQFMGNAKDDSYNAPLTASPEWWKDLQVHDLCVLGGEYEIFVDDIRAWTEKVKVYNPQTEYYLAPAEVHVQGVLDRILKIGIAKSEENFRGWILKRL